MDTGDGTSFVDLAPSASATDRPVRVAFQHDEPSGPEIWINDSNQRVPQTYKVIDGSEPALTLDGQKLAYVSRDGDIYVTVPGEAVPAGIRVAANVGQPRRLAWSPDGQYIAYATQDSVQRVSAAGGASAPEILVATGGAPSYLYGWDNALFPVSTWTS
jgi:Tol biopolymer transport system component